MNIVLIGAHPDDCEIKAGGTCAKWAEAGFNLHVVCMTTGDAGHYGASSSYCSHCSSVLRSTFPPSMRPNPGAGSRSGRASCSSLFIIPSIRPVTLPANPSCSLSHCLRYQSRPVANA